MTTTTARTTENTPTVTYTALVVDPTSTIQAIAQNWGWIMAAGVVSILGGIAALVVPAVATGVTGMFIAATLLVVGVINLAGLFFADKGLRLESFLTGTVQVLLAAVMAFYPLESLMSLTILIAGFMMADGMIRTVLAVQNRQVPGWGWTLAGGVASIASSIIVMVALPNSALWVIGVLVGVNLLTTGVARIAVALEGRKIAKAID